MLPSSRSALRLIVNRLASRSILTDEEEGAVLALTGQEKQFAAHIDFVRQGEEVDHSCLIVEGLAGRFGHRGRSRVRLQTDVDTGPKVAIDSSDQKLRHLGAAG
jgi:hypothetical protein